MATTNIVEIGSDEAALRLLKDALEHDLAGNIQMQFDAWPKVTIELSGPNYNGTITAGTAHALIEYQRAVDHAYSRLFKHGLQRLSNEEKKHIAIKAKVDEGSTLLTIDFNEALTQIASQLVGKMSPTDIVITVLGLGAIAGSSVVAKAFLKERATRLVKERELNAQLALSQQETARLGIVTTAMQRQSKLAFAKDDFDDARNSVLRGASDATSLQFEGLALTPSQTASISREPRASAIETQLNGIYTITSVAWQREEGAVLGLRSNEETREFKADLNTQSLLQNDKDLIAKAEWDRTPLYLSVNARLNRGEVVRATVVGFDWERLRNAQARQE